ncbi:Dabb family protein [Dyadobacter psychrotolerans]|uniref:Dabb family protein n=1 Tax=Dyadobacter psychrotolerans TaxID=2541721 RepID=A0A4R5DUV8_9BACT|nr:Dabb family protein [Dyadobacter psychrotolerans]TDE18292.1 Dabb family protein [Dyadobacter psychrotolerans]
MIYHSVFFKLNHPKHSPQEATFLEAAAKLVAIPGVENFQVLKQKSLKNNFDYGLLMEFEDQKKYDDYSNHAEHVQFIEDFWLKDVADFMEIDYEKMDSF